MCKTYKRTYACHHWIAWRPSICHGAFAATTIVDDGLIDRQYHPFCSGAVLINLQSTQFCGNCLRTRAEAKLEEIYNLAVASAQLKAMEVERIEGGNCNYAEWAADAALQRDRGLFVVNRDFPDCSYRTIRRPSALNRAKYANRRRESLLRRQVSPEDVVDAPDTMDWSWSSRWETTSSGETAEPYEHDAPADINESDVEHSKPCDDADEVENSTCDTLAEPGPPVDGEEIEFNAKSADNFRDAADESSHEYRGNETDKLNHTPPIVKSPINGLANYRTRHVCQPMLRSIEKPVSRVQQKPSYRRTCSSSVRRASTGQLSARSASFIESQYLRCRIAVRI